MISRNGLYVSEMSLDLIATSTFRTDLHLARWLMLSLAGCSLHPAKSWFGLFVAGIEQFVLYAVRSGLL